MPQSGRITTSPSSGKKGTEEGEDIDGEGEDEDVDVDDVDKDEGGENG